MKKEFELHLSKYLSKHTISQIKSVQNNTSFIALLIDEKKLDIDDFLKRYPRLEKHPFVKNAFIIEKDIYPFGKSLDFELVNFYIL